MPTDVISKVGATNTPTTMDYSTLQAWEDASPANLVSDDKRWIGECYDQGTFTAILTISGSTTDATRYKFLRCATGASFKDKAGVRSNALTYNSSGGVTVEVNTANFVIDVNESNARVEGLQVKRITGSHDAGTVFVRTAITARIDKCILVAKPSSASPSIETRSTTATLTNCLLMGAWGAATNYGNAYGCTIVKSGTRDTGVLSSYNLAKLVNCNVFGFGTLKSGSLASGSDYNATDLATSWGTGSNNLNSLTYADQFENSASDWRAKSTGDLQAGTPDSTNTPDDITGLTRDATTPWIGCWEVGGSSGPTGARRRRTIICGRAA